MDTDDSAMAPGDPPIGEPSFVAPPAPGAPLTGGPIDAVHPNQARDIAPATRVAFEWTRYTFPHPSAQMVTVGSAQAPRVAPDSDHFEVRFENQLGLATITARNASGVVIATHHVEVVAKKFASAIDSIQFLKATMADLHARIASAPFVLAAPTERFVRESLRPPNALFLFHFFRNHGDELVRAMQAVLGRPHQRLTGEAEHVRPHEVRRLDHESIVRMLRESLGGDPHGTTALQKLRPERVWQYLPAETFDTPENRFVLAVARRMLQAATMVMAQPWYASDVPKFAKGTIEAARAEVAMLTVDDRFAPLGPMVVTPAQSRVLQRRDGYRELTVLWNRFQRSREPLFEHLQTAINLRSIDKLYELWVLFTLINEITAITEVTPVLHAETTDFGVPTGGYRATFGLAGTLEYDSKQLTYSSLPLRPDYTWKPADGDWVVFDAKFRMARPAALNGEIEDDPDMTLSVDKAWAKTDDLTKMHAYRDAIRKVRAAVVLYPGTESVFRDVSGTKDRLSIADVLAGEWSGVGAIAMSPVGAMTGD